jgi:hypothetical protein
MTTTTATRTATPKQIAFMSRLSTERGLDFDATTWTEGPSSREARTTIDGLLALPKPQAARRATAPRPTTDIPAGRYAVPSRTGANDLDFWKIDRPTEGRWNGYTFVARILGGHDPIKVRGAEAAAAISAIESAGWQNAAQVYGQQIGSCGRCNRSLSDVTSRFTGFGSHCRSEIGIVVTAETREAAHAWAAANGHSDLLEEVA